MKEKDVLAGTEMPGMNVLLRPPGFGSFSASTGTSPYAERLHRRLYGTLDPLTIRQLWEIGLRSSANAPALLLGVPSDTGSGAARGSALGPIGVREAFYASVRRIDSTFGDAGDVFCIPHLLHDSMLVPELINGCRAAIYTDSRSARLPARPPVMNRWSRVDQYRRPGRHRAFRRHRP